MKAYAYIVPFAVYVFLAPLLSLVISSQAWVMGIKVVVLLALLFIYRKHYSFKLTLNGFAILTGIAIVLLWIGLEGLYPTFSSSIFIPETRIALVFRLISALILAPVIEEFFVRFFLNRVLIHKSLEHWEQLPVFKFTLVSFIITVLFFGFSHDRWLPGLLTGILLNVVLIKTKRIEDCVTAHFVANALLVIFILITHSWQFW
jgi:uncharacterized protein